MQKIIFLSEAQQSKKERTYHLKFVSQKKLKVALSCSEGYIVKLPRPSPIDAPCKFHLKYSGRRWSAVYRETYPFAFGKVRMETLLSHAAEAKLSEYFMQFVIYNYLDFIVGSWGLPRIVYRLFTAMCDIELNESFFTKWLPPPPPPPFMSMIKKLVKHSF